MRDFGDYKSAMKDILKNSNSLMSLKVVTTRFVHWTLSLLALYLYMTVSSNNSIF